MSTNSVRKFKKKAYLGDAVESTDNSGKHNVAAATHSVALISQHKSSEVNHVKSPKSSVSINLWGEQSEGLLSVLPERSAGSGAAC